jgi:hypothetical protein
MVTTVDISRSVWPLSMFDGWRRLPAYGKSRGVVLAKAEEYVESLVQEVAEASGRPLGWGRFLFFAGHVLGWGGLMLAVVGLFTLDKAHVERLLWGPFGIGLLMQLPSGALVRAGRRIMRPAAEELAAVDRRAAVLLLRSFRGDMVIESLSSDVWDALSQVGPLALAASAGDATRFGDADWARMAVLAIDQARLVVLMPKNAEAVGIEIEAIAKRRHAHKLLVLMPPEGAGASRAEVTAMLWPALRAALASVPGFETLPPTAPAGLMAVHLSTAGGITLVTGPRRPSGADVERALLVSLYGMKVHGRW